MQKKQQKLTKCDFNDGTELSENEREEIKQLIFPTSDSDAVITLLISMPFDNFAPGALVFHYNAK